jgi:hypothetical protein
MKPGMASSFKSGTLGIRCFLLFLHQHFIIQNDLLSGQPLRQTRVLRTIFPSRLLRDILDQGKTQHSVLFKKFPVIVTEVPDALRKNNDLMVASSSLF